MPNGTSQAHILVATTQAEALFGLQADLEMTPVIDGSGGKVCFSGSGDCVSWGSYSGGSTGTGTPAPAIPEGSSLVRDTSGGTAPDKLDGGDDTGDSAADFDIAAPSPTNNAGETGTVDGLTVQFSASTYSAAEDAEFAAVMVTVSGEGDEEVTVDYALSDGTATADEDYVPDNGTLTFETNSNQFPVSLIDDAVDEANETVELTLSNPTGATLGLAAATLTILDDDGFDDSSAPTTHIFFPQHNEKYNDAPLIHGTSIDEGSGVAMVEAALWKKLTSGKCRWWNGTRFVRGACGAKRFLEAEGTGEWSLPLGSDLGSSVGTKTKFYTAYARSTDVVGNVEIDFEKGRNANRFEIK